MTSPHDTDLLRESVHSQPAEDVLNNLGVDLDKGLTTKESRRRLSMYGPNRLRARRGRSAWDVFVSQLKSLVVALLVVAVAVSLFVGDWVEAFAIFVVIAVNTAIGFVTEMRALRSMEALRKMGATETRVRRDGSVQTIPAEEIVPGDVVVLEGGDVVTVDARIARASKLQCDESSLTGESVPVSKRSETVALEAQLADRRNMLFKGTSITRGSGEAVVVGTGMHTELGTISSLVEESDDEITPLELRLNQLGGRLVGVIVVIVVVVAVLGIVRGKDMWLMIETAIALAVASIPEGLPIVATIALSRGMLRMARRQALVRRLASVETLGSTSVICTDKTGTLTENRMTLERIEIGAGVYERDAAGSWSLAGTPLNVDDDGQFRRALELGVLCNNATLANKPGGRGSGDPLELSLLQAAVENRLDPSAIRDNAPELREDAFDSDTKMMATYHAGEDGILVAVKGAPEALLEHCTSIEDADGVRKMNDSDRTALSQRETSLGGEGYRLIAVAYRRAETENENPYENLTWLALLGMVDPPRSDIKQTIEECHRAGIRIIMVTGDQAQTAQHVARAVGIISDTNDAAIPGRELEHRERLDKPGIDRLREGRVFSRVSPRQKLELVAIHQEAGHVVAMTGDGVNDAPALKKADIGVAMGLRGTQVAREVADVVLKDDAFATIVYAVREGRIIFGNIRKFVLYLLSCNIAEILVVFLATLANMPLPILPLQILFLNLVTDVFPALALGAGEGHGKVMNAPPRPKSESILTRKHWAEICGYGFVISLVTLGAYTTAGAGFGWSREEQVTVAFLTLAIAQLWHVFNMREHDASLLNNQMTRNPYVWGALVLCALLLIGAVYLPPVALVLDTVPLNGTGWGLVLGCSFIPVVLDRIVRTVYRVAPR